MDRVARLGGALLTATLAVVGARARAEDAVRGDDRAVIPKALRAEIGLATMSRGYYCAYGDFSTNCSNVDLYEYAPLLFAAELEAGLSRAFGLALGVRYANGPYLARNRTFWEPTLDFVARFGDYRAGSSFRVRLGGGVWIGESAKAGLGGRVGLGGTLRGHSALGLAIDGVWEVGTFSGFQASTLQFGIGPELVF